MRFDTRGREFDLRVQRFLEGRWETEVGGLVRDRVIAGLKAGVEVRAILDDYILDDPDNLDPYGHPIYPVERIAKDEFWVLTSDDLRGIHFYNEDFSGSPSFEKKTMDYCRFFNCNFSNANMESCSFTRAYVKNCTFVSAIFADSGGFYTRFRDCDFSQACFWMVQFIEADFTGCNLRGVYFEDAQLIDSLIDYRTDFGKIIVGAWSTRTLPHEQLPDIYRMIRRSYASAELFARADMFLYKERKAFRKHILEPRFRKHPSGYLAVQWLIDALWDWSMGYATKPFRMLLIGIFLILLFVLTYWSVDVSFGESEGKANLVDYIYFSITSFSTLGFGDLVFGTKHPWLRLLSASEAMFGATWIAVFVAVLSRKLVK